MYKAIIIFDRNAPDDTPVLQEFTSTPQFNVEVFVPDGSNQVIFKHGLITEKTSMQATFRDFYDNERTVFASGGNGQASVQVVNDQNQEMSRYSLNVQIDL